MLGLYVHCRHVGQHRLGRAHPPAPVPPAAGAPGRRLGHAPARCYHMGRWIGEGPTRGIPGPVGEGSPETVGVTLAEQSPSWLPSMSVCFCALQGPCFPKHALHSSPIALLPVYVSSYPSSRCGLFSSSGRTIRYTWEADWMISLETCLGPIHRTSTSLGQKVTCLSSPVPPWTTQTPAKSQQMDPRTPRGRAPVARPAPGLLPNVVNRLDQLPDLSHSGLAFSNPTTVRTSSASLFHCPAVSHILSWQNLHPTSW